jgi:transposase
VAFREVDVVEIREVLRGWLDGGGLRTIAERAGVDRKTARRYVEAAQAAGLVRDAGQAALCDVLIGAVVERVRPARPNGHGAAWEALAARRADVAGWVKDGKTLVKIEELLARSGTVVPYRTLHRFAVAECGFRVRGTTVRVADGDPGVECQIDFAQMGFITDAETGQRRKVHALILTAVYSRHMYVHLSYGQTLADVIAGCEAAWLHFGGVFKVLVPDNLKPVVIDADPVNPRLSVGWLDYSQHAGFVTDPARVRRPQDKPRVERAVQYVRSNFFDGEDFPSLDAAQQAARRWCTEKAGMRIHGTTAARPLEVFDELEAPLLLPVPPVYDVPLFRSVKVHRDHHCEIGKALYSLPSAYIGVQLDARADSALVKLYHRGQLIKTHPRQRPGGRHTDPADLPTERTGYAMRDLERLQRTADKHGRHIGIYVFRLLDDKLPWTRMRAVYRLLALVRRYDAATVDAACRTALELDVVSVTKIAAMLAKALETAAPDLPAAAGHPAGRFARDPSEFTPAGRRRLHLVPDPTTAEPTE